MTRRIAALLPVLCSCVVSSAQVIWTPTESANPDRPYADNPHLSDHQAWLLWVLSGNRYRTNIHVQADSGVVHLSVRSPNVQVQGNVEPAQEAAPEEMRYFRMRDLLPEGQRPTTRPAEKPATTSATAVAPPRYPHQGEIVIMPYRPRRAAVGMDR